MAPPVSTGSKINSLISVFAGTVVTSTQPSIDLVHAPMWHGLSGDRLSQPHEPDDMRSQLPAPACFPLDDLVSYRSGNPNAWPISCAKTPIGLKSLWFDQRLKFNIAAFYYDYEDYQARLFINNAAVAENAAFADRDVWMADADFVEVPAAGVLPHGREGCDVRAGRLRSHGGGPT